MELANQREVHIRLATVHDTDDLSRLMETAYLRYRFMDWTIPDEWYGSPTFVVAESNLGLEDGLIGCIAVTSEVSPAGWVRLAALLNHKRSLGLLSSMLEEVIPALKRERLNEIGWLAATGWPQEILNSAGFRVANWITSYQVVVNSNKHVRYASEIVRPVRAEDIEKLAAIEVAAFEPIWRLSIDSLEKALGEALCYDVAVVGDTPVGFQISVNGWNPHTAHLVRITVHPDYQGRGIGSSLLAAAMEGYRLRGIEQVSLNTQIDNLASHKLYDRFGFSMVGDQIPLYKLRIAEED